MDVAVGTQRTLTEGIACAGHGTQRALAEGIACAGHGMQPALTEGSACVSRHVAGGAVCSGRCFAVRRERCLCGVLRSRRRGA